MTNSLRFFDVNCMIGNWYWKLEFSCIKSLREHMSRYKIDKAIVFHSLSWQYHPSAGNKKLIEEVSGNAVLYPALVLLPFATDETPIETVTKDIEDSGVKMVRVFPRDHNFRLSDWNCRELLNFLEGIRMPLAVDFDQTTPEDLLEICKNHSALPIVLTNVSRTASRIIYSLFSRANNLSMEISNYFIYGGIEDIVRKFGPERLLFGTQMPFFDPGSAVGSVIYAGISTEAKERIAFGNLDNLVSGVNLPGR